MLIGILLLILAVFLTILAFLFGAGSIKFGISTWKGDDGSEEEFSHKKAFAVFLALFAIVATLDGFTLAYLWVNTPKVFGFFVSIAFLGFGLGGIFLTVRLIREVISENFPRLWGDGR